MQKKISVLFGLVVLTASPFVFADLFALEIDGQVGYTQLDKVERPDSDELVTLKGGTVGLHGKLELLMISFVVDYQHFFKNADLLHLGFGMDIKLPLGVVEPYVRGSAGLMMLYAGKEVFDPDAGNDYETTLGAQARVGGGLDIPLGEWFAVGASVDLGAHYLTELAYDFSVMGYLGLRI